jgi:hypothetical protein
MIIQIIDLYGVTLLEPKCHSPIARDRDSIMSLQSALERVQSKAGQVHAFRSATPVQRRQDTCQFRDMSRRDMRRAPTLVKRLQAAMPE